VTLPPEPEPTDARALRFEQAVVTVALLAGFVFGVPLVIPVVALLLGAAVVAGARANAFFQVYDALFGRQGSVRIGETIALARRTRIVEAGLLLVATVFVLVDLAGLAWVFALPVAAITGLGATTGIDLVALVRDRRDRRP
jgi:hypothetical protein